MKHIKKFNELYDTDELKASNEIEGLSGDIIDKVKSIGDLDNQKRILYNKIIDYTPQLSICFEKSDADYYMREDEENGMIYFCFDGELNFFEIGLRKDNDQYSIDIVYNDWVNDEESFTSVHDYISWEETKEIIGDDLLNTLYSIGFKDVLDYKTIQSKNKIINSN